MNCGSRDFFRIQPTLIPPRDPSLSRVLTAFRKNTCMESWLSVTNGTWFLWLCGSVALWVIHVWEAFLGKGAVRSYLRFWWVGVKMGQLCVCVTVVQWEDREQASYAVCKRVMRDTGPSSAWDKVGAVLSWSVQRLES